MGARGEGFLVGLMTEEEFKELFRPFNNEDVKGELLITRVVQLRLSEELYQQARAHDKFTALSNLVFEAIESQTLRDLKNVKNKMLVMNLAPTEAERN